MGRPLSLTVGEASRRSKCWNSSPAWSQLPLRVAAAVGAGDGIMNYGKFVVAFAFVFVVGCGGGSTGSGSAGGGNSPSGPDLSAISAEVQALPKPTAQESSRFLQRATYGPTESEISDLTSSGYALWLAGQFTQPTTAH